MDIKITDPMAAAVELLDAAAGQLRQAMPGAGAVKSLALIPMIERAVSLADSVRALRAAALEDERDEE